ncbi:DEAD/DEAH box helicase family protein [Polluticoccus soli]|uniref:DEAD/DEAH box helicase family protein n=1 Tax=Polluticoccus soli TaxID=3034150 RepID=UPI0023E229A8|nr:DEAD/DEAH box helicase family protein [Flavipsychrobacter sp. JY13-12]
MNSNFSYIPSPFQTLVATLQEAEKFVYTAPTYAAVLCRKSLEEWVIWLYEHDETLEEPYDQSLSARIHAQSFKNLLGSTLFPQINLVRKMGNDAAHSNITIQPAQALHALNIMHGFTGWVVRLYADGPLVTVPQFDPSLVQKNAPAVAYKDKIKELEETLLQVQEINRKQQEELDRIQANKQKHGKLPPPPDPNEKVTRELYINLLLREAGWDPSGANVAEYPVTGMPTGDGKNNGPGYADYVLWGDDGKPLAVVEAKRTSKDATIGQHQAKLYADCLEKMHGQRPIIFFTNGFETSIWDDMHYPARKVHGFYKKPELELLIQRRTSRTSLQQATIDASIADRYYQIEAIRSVGKVLENNGREALLVMATGTGKTRTAAALVDVLSKCNWAKRILFLADRTALVRQAKNAFTNYLPNMPAVNLTEEKENTKVRVVFSTYQTMINLIDQEYDDNQRHFGVGHFDIIIFDEIHRSVYNRYQAIFQYFDGCRIGLTATPRSEGDRDTYHLFGLEPQNPTYAYELEQAVKDKFLVPPKSYPVALKFHREGIRYDELSPEEQRAYEEMFTDPITGEYPDEIDSTALNQWLFNADTVDHVLAHLMEHGIKVAGGDRLGKTIIFARNYKHAKFIEDRFNIQYPRYKGDFCKTIAHNEPYAYDILKAFTEKDKGPHIAVSVDMLDTGIDVPEVVNLVFYKPVRSRTKFWQMIGRGTRLCKDLFGPGLDKKDFVIFDFCENFEFFGKKPEGLETGQGKSITARLFGQRLKLIFHLQKKQEPEYTQYTDELISYLHGQVDQLDETSFLVRQHWRTVEQYRDKYKWNALNDLHIKELVDNIAGIVYEKDEDEAAKRFDNLCYTIQLQLLEKASISDNLIIEVQTLAANLSRRGAIPLVAAKMDLIKEVQSKGYWQNLSIFKIESTRRDLRTLMKFLEKNTGRILYSNFDDEIVSAAAESKDITYEVGLEAYKRKVRQYVLENANHLTIYKLRTAQPITAAEIQDLEKMLFEQGPAGSRTEFEKVYGKQPLGTFIRSILGMDINAAKMAFGKFINNPSLNAQQIRFVDMIIAYLTTNGTIDVGKLFEPPFTEINSSGLLGVFNPDEANELVRVIEELSAA